eukprot:EG_transcript_6582
MFKGCPLPSRERVELEALRRRWAQREAELRMEVEDLRAQLAHARAAQPRRDTAAQVPDDLLHPCPAECPLRRVRGWRAALQRWRRRAQCSTSNDMDLFETLEATAGASDPAVAGDGAGDPATALHGPMGYVGTVLDDLLVRVKRVAAPAFAPQEEEDAVCNESFVLLAPASFLAQVRPSALRHPQHPGSPGASKSVRFWETVTLVVEAPLSPTAPKDSPELAEEAAEEQTLLSGDPAFRLPITAWAAGLQLPLPIPRRPPANLPPPRPPPLPPLRWGFPRASRPP